MSVGTKSQIHAIMVSYKRPLVATSTLKSFLNQTRVPDSITVVDNSPESGLRENIERLDIEIPVHYIESKANLGPAGGIALGMTKVLEFAHDCDWILSIDDDDPPPESGTVERLYRLALDAKEFDSRVAGVGNVGQLFDFRRGRVVPLRDEQLMGKFGAVDHIGGGQCPLYLVAAVRNVGVFAGELFFGFEELEFGLRLRQNGWNLYCDSEWRLARRLIRDNAIEPSHDSPKSPQDISSMGLWRYYYSKRNLAYILRLHGFQFSAFRILFEGLVKSLIILATKAPRIGFRRVTLTLRACVDVLRGRMGLTVAPD